MCERREGEDFEAYRARRKIENKYAKNVTKPFSIELVNNELVRLIHKKPTKGNFVKK